MWPSPGCNLVSDRGQTGTKPSLSSVLYCKFTQDPSLCMYRFGPKIGPMSDPNCIQNRKKTGQCLCRDVPSCWRCLIHKSTIGRMSLVAGITTGRPLKTAHPCQWQDDKTNSRTTTMNMKDEVMFFPLCFFLLTDHFINLVVMTDPASQYPLEYQPLRLTVRQWTTTINTSNCSGDGYWEQQGQVQWQWHNTSLHFTWGQNFFSVWYCCAAPHVCVMWGSQYIYVNKNVVPMNT